jgi:transposase
MPKRLQVRALTSAEQTQLQQWSRSRTGAARTVERAQIIGRASQGQAVQQIADEMHVGAKLVRRWIERFNTDGLKGLEDHPRSGRPPRYSREQVGIVVATALTNPKELGQPFSSWTFERLTRYLTDVGHLPIQHSRVHAILHAEGVRWREQETWFGARVDPAFADKRGRLNSSTSSHQQAVA